MYAGELLSHTRVSLSGRACAASAPAGAGCSGDGPAGSAGAVSAWDFGVSQGRVQTVAIPDPDVENARVYLSNFEPSLGSKVLRGDAFFADPTETSLACEAAGPVAFFGGQPPADREVYAAKKVLVGFKSVKVRRHYDPEDNTLLYVAYADDFFASHKGDRAPFKTSLCALPGPPPPLRAQTEAAQ